MVFTTSISCTVNLPTFAVYNSRDVLAMTDVDLTVSPCPVWLAILTYENEEDEEDKVQLPMCQEGVVRNSETWVEVRSQSVLYQ